MKKAKFDRLMTETEARGRRLAEATARTLAQERLDELTARLEMYKAAGRGGCVKAHLRELPAQAPPSREEKPSNLRLDCVNWQIDVSAIEAEVFGN